MNHFFLSLIVIVSFLCVGCAQDKCKDDARTRYRPQKMKLIGLLMVTIYQRNVFFRLRRSIRTMLNRSDWIGRSTLAMRFNLLVPLSQGGCSLFLR